MNKNIISDVFAKLVVQSESFRIIIPVCLTFALFVLSFLLFFIPSLEKQMMNQKKEMIRALTESTCSLLSVYNQRVKDGELTLEDSRSRIVKRIRGMRYGPEGKDYFWINDMHSRMVMHPYLPGLEGQDLTEYTDPNGKHIFVEFVNTVRTQGSGYVDYMWQWKDNPERIVPKISYVKLFEPWGWIIGTGIYVEDVRSNISSITQHLFKIFAGILAIVMVLAFYIIWQTIKGEKKREMADEALRESEERYRTIFEDSRDAIYINTQKGEFLDVNQSMLELFGYTKEEMVGMNAINLYANPLDRTESLRKIAQKGSHKDYEMRLKKKDGKEMDCLLTSTVKMADDGSIIGYQGIFRDITERKRLDKEKKKLQAQLQRAQKMEAIGTLAGGVAHDLNNVLSGIVSYPDLLLMDIPEDSPLRKPILTIQESGQKAADIVQDLLTLARRGIVATNVMNINQVIDSYLKSPEYEKLKEFYPDAKIESDLETYLLNIIGSPVHLSKTVMNLVTNAAEAMPTGGSIFISTKSKYIDRPIRGYDDVKEGDYVILSVSDSGTGISSGDLERIFEPFYTKKVMGRSGTGLGMAVVWGTVKDHKGYIDVQSNEGKGTTFTLYFPVTRKEVKGKEKVLAMEEYMGKGESVLVVDDVKEQREIASRILKKLGYSATSVSSGEKAVHYMKDNSADLLILDMIMDPGIDGFDTYKRILKLHPGVKAIITSGFSETERVKEAQRLGAAKYIKKPYTMEKIGVAVKEELEK